MHLIQRGNNRGDCFFADVDYRVYLEELGDACQANGVALHAYCLMTNHVHLLLTPTDADAPSRVMKRLGQRYVQYVNRSHQRSGTLWEGRFRSCPVDEDSYLLACYRYVELNPVRAGMVADPADHRWSSHRANAFGETSALITPHGILETLGPTAQARRAAYREFFERGMEADRIGEIRDALNGGFALGAEAFQKRVAALTGRRTWRGSPGRPAKRPVGTD
ncbi:transposase IS200 [Skermanella stibiiresistens SB22]|uniref:Transposase IS200 n=1 Tax=Skermanella stibiiresistens SB22 TaxID=1385369 RepID=W9GXH0_9PROT|nr:transposase IS200 [Skermanella stibiiresistens SB22]